MKKSKACLALLLTISCFLSGCSNGTKPSSVQSVTPSTKTTETVPSETAYNEYLPPEMKREFSVRNMKKFDSSKEFKVVFEGEWDKITDEGYKHALQNEFYQVYPRLYTRWGTGNEPKTIHLIAESNTEDIACSWEDKVQVQVQYANEHPEDIGFLAHELTHNIQSYPVGLKWWTEGFASYGRFRYFHWAADDSVYLIDQKGEDLINWRYEPYGECVLFFAYMDYKFPTLLKNGKWEPGLVDSIHNAIKNGEITDDSDPYTPGNPFNDLVKKMTGYDTIEALREKYVEECVNGTWVFDGFGRYKDNVVLGMHYPQIKTDVYDRKTAPMASTVKEYADNVFKDARIIRCSGFINENENSSMLVDGKYDTKWCAEKGDVTDVSMLLKGVYHYILIDLGSIKTFSSYTLHNAGTIEDESYNATSWELLWSNDTNYFVPLDYQKDCKENVATFEIGEVTCRYILLKIYVPDSGPGTVRLYELSAGV